MATGIGEWLLARRSSAEVSRYGNTAKSTTVKSGSRGGILLQGRPALVRLIRRGEGIFRRWPWLGGCRIQERRAEGCGGGFKPYGTAKATAKSAALKTAALHLNLRQLRESAALKMAALGGDILIGGREGSEGLLLLSCGPLGAEAVAPGFGEGEPGFGQVADAFQCGLHFGLLRFQRIAVGVGGDANGGSDEHDCTRERERNLEKVPGILKRVGALDGDVKHRNRTPSATRENHGAGFGDVARAARTVDCERDVVARFEMPGHGGQAFDGSARRTSLRRREAQTFDYAARPLTIEVDRVEHRDAAVAPDPRGRENAAVPERADGRLASARITQYTAQAMTGICMRRQRERWGWGIAEGIVD
jgi:hypothetical protein